MREDIDPVRVSLEGIKSNSGDILPVENWQDSLQARGGGRVEIMNLLSDPLPPNLQILLECFEVKTLLLVISKA